MNTVRNTLIAAALSALPVSAALAGEGDSEILELSRQMSGVELSFKPAVDEPPADAPQPAADAKSSEHSSARSLAYGRTGSRWWTIGGLYANDFEDASDANIHIAFSEFLADELEFAVEVAGWYFDQPGDDTGGISGSMVFRWHFLHAKDFKWTIFGDAGIGLLGAFDVTPDGGTGFNFLPRAGGGVTWALDDSVNGESRGPRLMLGVRWHHISNANIHGDDNNPSRDSLAGYVAITFPF